MLGERHEVRACVRACVCVRVFTSVPLFEGVNRPPASTTLTCPTLIDYTQVLHSNMPSELSDRQTVIESSSLDNRTMIDSKSTKFGINQTQLYSSDAKSSTHTTRAHSTTKTHTHTRALNDKHTDTRTQSLSI